jgi:uncharacterized protein
MKKQMKRLFTILFVVLCQASLAQRAVPPLWGHRVHDEAHVLKAETIDKLESMLKQHEDSTTNQIAVLIIPSLEGDVLEAYSLRVAHTEWKLGKDNNDNGVLLLIAVEDRKMRIEVGQGLEGPLPDAVANRIIRNEIAPHFREQEYDAGVIAGVEGIIDAIGGEYAAEATNDTFDIGMSWSERLFMGLFVFSILGLFTVIGLFSPGCAGWFLYAFLIPFYATFPLAVLGVQGGLGLLGVYVIGFPILKLLLGRSAWGKKMASSMGNSRRSRGWSSGSGWFSGGSSGGGWSSGGGGFSGGGGSFGGGGSSGSW